MCLEQEAPGGPWGVQGRGLILFNNPVCELVAGLELGSESLWLTLSREVLPMGPDSR